MDKIMFVRQEIFYNGKGRSIFSFSDKIKGCDNRNPPFPEGCGMGEFLEDTSIFIEKKGTDDIRGRLIHEIPIIDIISMIEIETEYLLLL
jgi:hypothetical protein